MSHVQAGRQGFEPWVQFYPHNRLAGGSDRPLRHLPERSAFKAEGEGFEPPVTTRATAVFKTAALNHSAIPPFLRWPRKDVERECAREYTTAPKGCQFPDD